MLDRWQMPPNQFNEWRAENDIPKVFDFLTTILPGFVDWMGTLSVDRVILHRVVPTGELFKGERKKVIIKRPGDLPSINIIECFEGSADDVRQRWGTGSQEVEILTVFEPYFKWARRTLKRKRLIWYDPINHQVADDLVYTRWSGSGSLARAFLFGKFEVLKLGHVTLPSHVMLGSRNLDFCNLDGLTVEGKYHGSWWTYINYSSCRDINFLKTEIAFVTFFKCFLDELSIDQSNVQDLYFINSGNVLIKAQNSFIFRIGFKETAVRPFFRNTEVRELNFKPKSDTLPSEIATSYRLFRAIFQTNGLRKEASEYYYKERVFERKSYYNPYDLDRSLFPNIMHGGRIYTVLKFYRRGYLNRESMPREIGKVFIAKLKLLISPRLVGRLVKYRVKWLASLLESALWGYGERPSRIFLASVVAIAVFATYYHEYGSFIRNSGGVHLGWWDSLYFSMVTFTTLGYGDIYPKVDDIKIVAGLEALFGAFAIGLSVAGFSNRSRY